MDRSAETPSTRSSNRLSSSAPPPIETFESSNMQPHQMMQSNTTRLPPQQHQTAPSSLYSFYWQMNDPIFTENNKRRNSKRKVHDDITHCMELNSHQIVPQSLLNEYSDIRGRKRLVIEIHVQHWIDQMERDIAFFETQICMVLNVYYPNTTINLMNEIFISFLMKKSEMIPILWPKLILRVITDNTGILEQPIVMILNATLQATRRMSVKGCLEAIQKQSNLQVGWHISYISSCIHIIWSMILQLNILINDIHGQNTVNGLGTWIRSCLQELHDDIMIFIIKKIIVEKIIVESTTHVSSPLNGPGILETILSDSMHAPILHATATHILTIALNNFTKEQSNERRQYLHSYRHIITLVISRAPQCTASLFQELATCDDTLHELLWDVFVDVLHPFSTARSGSEEDQLRHQFMWSLIHFTAQSSLSPVSNSFRSMIQIVLQTILGYPSPTEWELGVRVAAKVVASNNTDDKIVVQKVNSATADSTVQYELDFKNTLVNMGTQLVPLPALVRQQFLLNWIIVWTDTASPFIFSWPLLYGLIGAILDIAMKVNKNSVEDECQNEVITAYTNFVHVILERLLRFEEYSSTERVVRLQQCLHMLCITVSSSAANFKVEIILQQVVNCILRHAKDLKSDDCVVESWLQNTCSSLLGTQRKTIPCGYVLVCSDSPQLKKVESNQQLCTVMNEHLVGCVLQTLVQNVEIFCVLRAQLPALTALKQLLISDNNVLVKGAALVLSKIVSFSGVGNEENDVENPENKLMTFWNADLIVSVLLSVQKHAHDIKIQDVLDQLMMELISSSTCCVPRTLVQNLLMPMALYNNTHYDNTDLPLSYIIKWIQQILYTRSMDVVELCTTLKNLHGAIHPLLLSLVRVLVFSGQWKEKDGIRQCLKSLLNSLQNGCPKNTFFCNEINDLLIRMQ